MMDATQQIELFGTLFYVCLAIAVIGLGLAIFFFFFFDIRSVHALMTGKAKRQTIERMAELNSRTGRLKQPISENIKSTGPVIQHPASAVTANSSTVQLDVTADTTVLQAQAAETSVLNSGTETGETVVLTAQPQMKEPPIRFDVTENTLVIHTTEIL